MAPIRLLPEQEIKKIAAGEVVERPATIVKELVENALDAQATAITVYVYAGGCNGIRVVDNGCGMEPEDARLACMVHTTSKITSVDDLQTLVTYGFRGEALASIAAVSHVTLITRDDANSAGIKLVYEYAAMVQESEVACSCGCDITIERLFDNIPARKKFLKTVETELRVITTLFQSFVLAHPVVHFQLLHEDALLYNCPPVQGARDRCVQLWDQYVTQNLIPVSLQDTATAITGDGLISTPQYVRYNTAHIFLFVNKRWIRNSVITRALVRGYAGSLPQGRYPLAVIFITVDPALIDVNIHPRKEEVKFLYEHKVEHLVQQAVKDALETRVTHQVQHVEPTPVTHAYAPTIRAELFSKRSNPIETVFTPGSLLKNSEDPFCSEAAPEKILQPLLPVRAYRIVGQLYKTYIVLEKDEEVVFVDQHAAHERILFEHIVKNREQAHSIALLFPQMVLLEKEACRLLGLYTHELERYGIVGDCMGDDRFVVRQVPVYLKHVNLIDLIHEFVTFLCDANSTSELFLKNLHERLCIQMACKAAAKAGDELSHEKIYEILDNLEQVENRSTCPHGRPTVWSLHKNDFEKKFKRDYVR